MTVSVLCIVSIVPWLVCGLIVANPGQTYLLFDEINVNMAYV